MGERWLVDRYNIRQSLRCDANGESLPIDPASYPEDWDLLLTDVFTRRGEWHPIPAGVCA